MITRFRIVEQMRTTLVVLLVATVAAAGCSDDGGGSDGAPIVVTTNILGDIVEHLVGGDVEVDVVMPPNASPHDFAPSAQQAAAMRAADVLVVNGLGFEEGLTDTIEAAAADGVDLIAVAELAPGHLVAGEEAHDHEDDQEAGFSHDGEDPHVFTDPRRMQQAVTLLGEQLATRVTGLDTDAFRARVADYTADLGALDAEIEAMVAELAPERRVLVTNHEVLGYFADRYGFEVLGTIIPSLSTGAEPSASDLADLADEIAAAGVPAIFAETSSPARLAEALAAEGTDVEVVELYGESLGEDGSEADTYIGMVRTNATRIVEALSP
jgi:zinc/manganese transport system substrate-binding protein